jgi:hypothetical protein
MDTGPVEVSGVAIEGGLSEISELKEFNDYNEANIYLKLGWILLSIRLEDSGDPDVPGQETIYMFWLAQVARRTKEPVGKVHVIFASVSPLPPSVRTRHALAGLWSSHAKESLPGWPTSDEYSKLRTKEASGAAMHSHLPQRNVSSNLATR